MTREDAVELVGEQQLRKWAARMRRNVRALNKLLQEVREAGIVDATWYLQEDSLHLMAGLTHNPLTHLPQRDRTIANETLRWSDGGGW